MTVLKVINLVDCDDGIERIAIQKNLFFSPRFARVVFKSYNLQSKFVLYTHNGARDLLTFYLCPIGLGWHKKAVVLPFVGMGIELPDYNTSSYLSLVKDLSGFGYRPHVFEYRFLVPSEKLSLGASIGSGLMNKTVSELAKRPLFSYFQLDIHDGTEKVWTGKLTGRVRTAIRKADKAQLVWSIGNDKYYLDNFYTLYYKRMKELGSPAHKKTFFERLLAEFVHEMFISTVTYKKRVISALWLWKNKGILGNTWGAPLREARSLEGHTYNYWKAIQWAINNGCSTFDFGRSVSESTHAKFKEGWGADNKVLIHCHINGSLDAHFDGFNPHSSFFKLASKAWQVVPSAFLDRISPTVLKRYP